MQKLVHILLGSFIVLGAQSCKRTHGDKEQDPQGSADQKNKKDDDNDDADVCSDTSSKIPDCSVDDQQVENVKSQGASSELLFDWQILPGKFSLRGAENACKALGSFWRLAKRPDLNALFKNENMRVPKHIGCKSIFWVDHKPSACGRVYRGFFYEEEKQQDYKNAFDKKINLREINGASVAEDAYSALCVKPQLAKLSCRERIELRFELDAVGIVDPGSNVSWSRINPSLVDSPEDVFRQCGLGNSDGFRAPDKSLIQNALGRDFFLTNTAKEEDCPEIFYASAAEKGCLTLYMAAGKTEAKEVDCKKVKNAIGMCVK